MVMPAAGSLTCPQCGAAAGADAVACAFCHARLATLACPECFGLVFVGSRHCVHCGAKAERPAARDGAPRRCPAGCGPLQGVAIGGAELGECPACSGLWLDERTFERLCGDREHHAEILVALPGWLGAVRPPTPAAGTAAAVRQPTPAAPVHATAIRYRPCADCGKLMNRVNFARVSGVVLDACRAHGVWCDADELRQVIEFVAAGGMAVAQRRERMALEEERRLAHLRRAIDQDQPRQDSAMYSSTTGTAADANGLLVSFLSLFVP